MTTSPAAFDHHFEQWIKEQEMPWGVLRYKQTQATIAEQLERLEFALMDRYPYKLLARYYHVIARKR